MLLTYIAILAWLGHKCLCLESPEPEVLLQPRNYNPHPYQGRRLPPTANSRRGPVLFPATNVQPATQQSVVLVGLPLVRPVAAEAEHHPYANVARKQRIKLAGRFSSSDQENNISPQVYSGLANYAAKVLKKPGATRYNNYHDPTLAGEKKDYAFSYTVRDQATGDDFSHKQAQDAKSTHGEYRVKLPDGRVQIVSYTADKNGYKADVKYADDNPVHTVSRPSPIAADDDYNYQLQEHGPVSQGNPLTQIEIPLYQQNHATFQATPVPQKFYQNGQKYATIYPGLDELQKHSRQYVPQDKVQIYPQGEQKLTLPQPQVGTNIQSLHATVQAVHPSYEQKLSNIRATVVPYTDSHILKGYDGNVLVTTVPSDQYSGQVYVTTPRYNFVQSTQNYYKKR